MKHLRIKKKVLLMLSSVIIPLSMSADDNLKLLVYDKTQGNVTEIPVNDVLKLTFQETAFTIDFYDVSLGKKIFYYDDVSSMKFGETPTGIGCVTPDADSGITIAYDGRNILISGCEAGTKLMMYDISGRPVMNAIVDVQASISTEGIARGIYVVRVNNKTFKFNKL